VGPSRKSEGIRDIRHQAPPLEIPKIRFGFSTIGIVHGKLRSASRAHERRVILKRARKPNAVRNEARGTWVFFPVIDGRRTTRKLGSLKELTQEQANRRAEEKVRSMKLKAERESPTVLSVVEQYRIERMPKLRPSTQRVAKLWIKKYVLGHWGNKTMTDLQPRPVELWVPLGGLCDVVRFHSCWNQPHFVGHRTGFIEAQETTA
jgi:hypothetical protein